MIDLILVFVLVLLSRLEKKTAKPEATLEKQAVKFEPETKEEEQRTEPEEEEQLTESKAEAASAGLNLENLVKVQPEFCEYKPYVEAILQDLENSNSQTDENFFQNQDTSLETISKKLAYV